MLAVVSVLLCGHSQNFGVRSCQKQDGTITVHNPAISTTYWVEDTTCTFDLHGYDQSIDQVGITRSSRPAAAGTLQVTHQGASTTYSEDVTVHGTGEPFAILPMYSTRKLDHVHADTVVVAVQGKAMVSFGMAEDPALVFGEVVTDAYRARHWVYGAPYEMLYIHVGMLAALLAVLAAGTCNLERWFCGMPFFAQSYADMRAVAPQLANVALTLGVWSDVSAVVDNFLWAGWVWHDIGRYGGGLFIAVVVVRCLLYAYLMYVVWEHPKPLGSWAPGGQRWLVPLATGGVLTAYVAAWLYMGRDAFSSGAAGYYVGIPVVVGTLCCILPVVAAVAGWERLYVAGTCLGQLALVTLIGIVLNVGLGLLAPACMLTAFYKRKKAGENAKVHVQVEIELATRELQPVVQTWRPNPLLL